MICQRLHLKKDNHLILWSRAARRFFLIEYVFSSVAMHAFLIHFCTQLFPAFRVAECRFPSNSKQIHLFFALPKPNCSFSNNSFPLNQIIYHYCSNWFCHIAVCIVNKKPNNHISKFTLLSRKIIKILRNVYFSDGSMRVSWFNIYFIRCKVSLFFVLHI